MSKPQGHHPLWPRTQWTATESTQVLRCELGVVSLTPDDHGKIHADVPVVPLLSPVVAYRVGKEFLPVGNGVERVSRMINAIDIAIRHPSTHHMEKQLGMLTMTALAAQLPILDREIR